MVSLKGIFPMDLRYPGTEIKVELIVLRAYLSQMEKGVNSVCENYIMEEEKTFKDAEYYEYQHVYTIAEDELPRIIRMPFVVSIYALFENSVERLLDYAKIKENKELSLKDINGRSPLSKQNKYMKHVLGYDYQFSSTIMNKINNISKVRNYVAHANGNISNISKEKIKDLEKIADEVVGLTVDPKFIDISYDYLIHSMETIESSLKDLMNYMESKYGIGQTVRN
ncbi:MULTISPECIES: hypothetical protein [Marinomonas]|uniref:MAE-28990/MAE-18760-like HEPN domain-containing protein n=1 Tax=Marinomonas arctica TaxID=383750 RepID=A0A7H1J1H8_9GAMM|nr:MULTISPECIES: hypothetical protein [Marinomonas]QNT04344.1 hypothetical protein IBG28_11365 [Marinomonas arctica]GGN37559.1 hypothetical protein GCM10011350_36930 [Marinomonas arctica]